LIALTPIRADVENEFFTVIGFKKEKVDQRKIVSESGFSKAKVSRIIQNLVGRGVVESERIGRKNIIKLKKHFRVK